MNGRFILILLTICTLAVASLACGNKGGGAKGVDRYNRGVGLLEAGDYKGAIVEFEAALRADPTNFEAIKNLAGAYVEDGQFEQARAQYAQAQAMRPDDPSVYVNLSYVYQQLGETQAAWSMIQTAIEKDPAYPLAHYRAGEMFLAQDNKVEAEAAFKDYLRLEPGSRLATEAMAILETLGPQQPISTELSTQPEETVPVQEELPPAEENAQTTATTTQQETETATSTPAEQPASTPNNSTASQHENTSAQTSNTQPPAEPPASQPPAEVTPPPQPEEPPLTGDALYEDRLSRGRQMRAIGAFDAAIRLLEEAYSVHPEYAQVNYELGLAYIADEQTCEGRDYLERYVELETDEQARDEAQARLNNVVCDETSTQGSTGQSEGMH